MGRVSQGVIGIKLDKDDTVIGMESIVSGSKRIQSTSKGRKGSNNL